MSSENVEVVRRLYDAMNARDGMALVEFMHHEMVWRPNEDDPEQDVRHGVREVAEAVSNLWEAFETLTSEIDEVLAANGKVAVLVRHYARGRESGVEVDRIEFHVWTIRDGKAVELAEFPDREQALRAANL